MRVLITGGAGFIGSHLAEALLARGDEVLALDDLSTGCWGNLSHLQGEPRFGLRVGSACDPELVRELLAGCEAVVHLAAAVGVLQVVERPVQAILGNLDPARTVLEAAAERGTPVLLASSSEVYGTSGDLPFREETGPVLGPTSTARWGYGCAKALEEWLAFAFAAEQGLPVTVARLFNTVGPRQTGRYGMVLPRFVRQALEGRPLTVHGDGRQTRCFAHVREVAEALARLLSLPAARGLTVNVGSDREMAVRDLAALVLERSGSRSAIRLVPYEHAYGHGFADMSRRVPDLSRLRRLTGFTPQAPLEVAVDEVIQEQRRLLAQEAGALGDRDPAC